MSGGGSRVVRCAIYTRKSSDEGLEQEYNSLDAQYDACRAFIASQVHEGWMVLPDRFDDGGFSGGTLHRPALQQLLARIDTGQIDLVIVYKIDRLTRSLADFTKLVERFGRTDCSFASVTQSFNTSTSTGRLMLNVLLSFAQFEREATGERIRDKIAASKRKGMWMGGVPPLGYSVRERKLVIESPEAGRVGQLFDLFQEHRCLNKTWRIANDLGIRSRPTAKYPKGPSLRRSGILWILMNPLYAGLVRHKNNTYPGQHEPIISADAWNNVQKLVAKYLTDRRGKVGHPQRRSWLVGKVFAASGARLVPRFGSSASCRRRYYVSPSDSSTSHASDVWRVRADMLEQLVAVTITKHIDSARQHQWPSASGHVRKGDGLKQDTPSRDLLDLVQTVHLRQGLIEIAIPTSRLSQYLPSEEVPAAGAMTRISAPFQYRRAGQEARLILGDRPAAVDPRLLKFVSQGAAWWQAIVDGQSIAAIAKLHGVSVRQITLHLPSAFLAPDIVEAIVDGRQPSTITVEVLRSGALPTDWVEQRRLLGMAPISNNETETYPPIGRAPWVSNCC